MSEVNSEFVVGTRVKFLPGVYKTVDRSDFDCSNLTGTVMNTDMDDCICIRMDEHFECLDEWDNQLIFQPEDEEEWDRLSKNAKVLKR